MPSALATRVPEPRIAASLGDASSVCSLWSAIQSDLSWFGVSLLKGTDSTTDRAIQRIAALAGSLALEIDPQLTGPPVMDVRYDAAKVSTSIRPAYFTSDAFPLHTDLSYVPHPPRFLIVQCVVPAPSGQGLTLLSDCSLTREALSEDVMRTLAAELFRFRYPPGCQVGAGGLTSVYQNRGSRGFWRFRRDGMDIPAEAEGSVDAFSAALETAQVELALASGDLLIIDNHRLAHGRTPFDPTSAEGQNRHLRRSYARALD
jgi:alpha-ketoglutarate-dependent taurine dioxygenase